VSISVRGWLIGIVLAMTVVVPGAVGYIHFPPMTLQKMCKTSTHIRVLSIKKHDKEKGVLLFEVVETLKGPQSRTRSFKHALRTDAEGVKPILDWVEDGKWAVMFWIEGGDIACGYVFLEGYCYSVDYNKRGILGHGPGGPANVGVLPRVCHTTATVDEGRPRRQGGQGPGEGGCVTHFQGGAEAALRRSE
jgi:hypothetical protein